MEKSKIKRKKQAEKKKTAIHFYNNRYIVKFDLILKMC